MSQLPRRREFRLIERALRPGCREIQVEGELDMSVADRLREALDRASASDRHVLVGLGECEFLDSTGIAVIVHAQMRIARDGGRLMIHGASGNALRILSMTGLTESGILFEDADAALAACGEAA